MVRVVCFLRQAGFVAGLFLICVPVQAQLTQIGKLTVDGVLVDPDIFDGFTLHMMTKAQRCSPHSDSFVRDKVVEWFLVANSGHRAGATPRASDLKQIDKYTEELESLKKQARQQDRIKTRKALIAFYRHSSYMHAVRKSVTPAQVRDAYLQAVTDRDPLVTNVVALKIDRLELVPGHPDSTRAVDQLTNGAKWHDVIREHGFSKESDIGYVDPFLTNWRRPDQLKYYQGDASELSVGDLIGPARNKFWVGFELVRAKHVIPLLHQGERYFGWSDYVSKQLRYRLIAKGRYETIERLWQRADIREDNVRLVKSSLRPDKEWSILPVACPN